MSKQTSETLSLQQELEKFVENHLPALQRLEFVIEQADASSVLLSAPLSANFNDKGTAFGGSQAVLALSCAWGFTYLNMVDQGQKETQFVIAEANIRYLRPTTSKRFYALATRPDQGMNEFIENARRGERGKVVVEASIYNEDPRDADNKEQKTNSALEATFAIC